jgi:DNA-binding GntR family transcriptional regulator
VEAQVPAQRGASGVLADRMAAALVHREPGWQLPRRSALARRYNVSMAEIDVALGELARRSLIRRLPDGQLYRASPAEYLIPVEGIDGLSTRLDPMGGEIACQARHVSQRAAPQDVAWALGTEGEGKVRIIRCVWAVGAEPVAISTAYVPGAAHREAGGPDGDGAQDADDLASFQAMLQTPPDLRPGTPAAHARAVDLELAPPQPSVARSLRLLPGQPAITVTIRFDDQATGAPIGLTTVTLVPDQFRIVIQAGGALPRGTDSGE